MSARSRVKNATGSLAPFTDGRPVIDYIIHEGEVLLLMCDEHAPAPVLASLIASAGRDETWLALGRVVATDIRVVTQDAPTLRRYVLAEEKRNGQKHPYRVVTSIDAFESDVPPANGPRLLIVDDLHALVEDDTAFDGSALVAEFRNIKAMAQRTRVGALVVVYVCEECNGAYRSAIMREANAAIVFMGDALYIAKDGRRDPNNPRQVALQYEDVYVLSSFTPVVSVDDTVIGGAFSNE